MDFYLIDWGMHVHCDFDFCVYPPTFHLFWIYISAKSWKRFLPNTKKIFLWNKTFIEIFIQKSSLNRCCCPSLIHSVSGLFWIQSKLFLSTLWEEEQQHTAVCLFLPETCNWLLSPLTADAAADDDDYDAAAADHQRPTLHFSSTVFLFCPSRPTLETN